MRTPPPLGHDPREGPTMRPDQRHRLLWTGAIVLLIARPVLAVAAQGLVAAIYAARGAVDPWQRSEPWLTVYGSLIDIGCLALLWWFARREGVSLKDILGFQRRHLGRDIWLGLALVPPSLIVIFGGVALSGLLVYGESAGPQFSTPLPPLATTYSLLIWPALWALTEQTVYNGYVFPRLRLLAGTTLAVIVVAAVWAAQHAFMPLIFDSEHMLHRFLGSLPNSFFMIYVFMRLGRLLPLIIAHWLMDAATVLVPLIT